MMKELGLTGDYFSIKYGVISRHIGKDDAHNLSDHTWKTLCSEITKPFAIAKYGDGFRVFTNVVSRGKYVAAGVDVKNAGKGLEVNAVSTAFGYDYRRNEQIIYRAENITPDQTALLDRPSLSLPSEQEDIKTIAQSGEKSRGYPEYHRGEQKAPHPQTKPIVCENGQLGLFDDQSLYQTTDTIKPIKKEEAGHEKPFIQDISKDTAIGKLYPAKDFAVNDPAIRVFSPEANLIRKNLSINPSDMKNAPQGQYMKAMNHYPPLYEKGGLIHVPCARDDDKTGFPAKEELILTKRQAAALIDFSLKYEKAQCAGKEGPVFAKRDVMSEEHNKLLASVFPGTTREQRQEKYTALYRSLEAEVTAMNREAGFMRKPEISQAKKETPVQQKAVKPKSRDDGFER